MATLRKNRSSAGFASVYTNPHRRRVPNAESRIRHHSNQIGSPTPNMEPGLFVKTTIAYVGGCFHKINMRRLYRRIFIYHNLIFCAWLTSPVMVFPPGKITLPV